MHSLDILILAGAPEGPFLRDLLLLHRPELQIGHAMDREDLMDLSAKVKTPARLISFCTATIVPEAVIQRFEGNCYNFHPAPPSYPGYRPSGFALYRGEHEFGVTAHKLIREIDAGEIVDTQYFPIDPDWSNYELGIAAYAALVDMVRDLAPLLANIGTPLVPNGEKWGSHTFTRKEYDRMKCISTPLEDAELRARYKCFDGIYCPLEA